MFIGHYGPAYALKRWQPGISLFTLFIAVQLVDVAWAVLVLLGIEKVRIVPGITATNPLDLYYMPYTHGLITALIWSVACGSVYALYRSRPARWHVALAVGIAVFSHWLLDFLVHRPDLPLYADTAKVGLGLWNLPAIAFALEIALLAGGLVIYLKATRATNRRGRIGFWVFTAAMIGMQGTVFFARPPETPAQVAVTALVSYFLLAGIAWWLERGRVRA